MVSMGMRLREERDRLGMNQDDFAALGSLTKRALSRYENDERSPDAAFLAAIAAVGADVLYIVTGQRSAPVAPQQLLNKGDQVLLDNFHAAPAQVREGVKTTLGAFAPSADGAASDRPAAKRGKAA